MLAPTTMQPHLIRRWSEIQSIHSLIFVMLIEKIGNLNFVYSVVFVFPFLFLLLFCRNEKKKNVFLFWK